MDTLTYMREADIADREDALREFLNRNMEELTPHLLGVYACLTGKPITQLQYLHKNNNHHKSEAA